MNYYVSRFQFKQWDDDSDGDDDDDDNIVFAVVLTNDIIRGMMLMKHSSEIKTITFSVWCHTVWYVQRNILHIQDINSLEHMDSMWYCLHLGVTCLRFEVFVAVIIYIVIFMVLTS